MLRRILLTTAAFTLAGGALLATPASAATVTVTNEGGCTHVYYGSKDLTFNGLCYLGPPAPELP